MIKETIKKIPNKSNLKAGLRQLINKDCLKIAFKKYIPKNIKEDLEKSGCVEFDKFMIEGKNCDYSYEFKFQGRLFNIHGSAWTGYAEITLEDRL